MSEDDEVVNRRVRNQVLHWLETAVDIERNPPPFDLNEIINQWYDWNDEELSNSELYRSPAYTEQEAEAASAVREAVERFCAASPQTILDSDAAFALPEWQHLKAAANRALGVMRLRGVRSSSRIGPSRP